MACKDPFELVNGLGIEKMGKHGIHTNLGLLEEEAQYLNRKILYIQ